jgi:hypothetical protein
MSPVELADFLSRPYTAIVSYADRHGAPRAVPVWYRHQDGAVTIWSDTSRGWLKALMRDPRCTITVAQNEIPFAAAILRGGATIATGTNDVLEEARRICARYIAPADLDAYMDRWAALDSIVTVRIEESRAWGQGY